MSDSTDAIDWPALGQAALKAAGRAYAPYSRFYVGAALLSEDGTVFLGCNVENASYGLTQCAERTAVGAAIAQGHTKFRAIAVATRTTKPTPPCGMCRQVLAEVAPHIPVHCVTENGDTLETTVAELLPHQFDRENLRDSIPPA